MARVGRGVLRGTPGIILQLERTLGVVLADEACEGIHTVGALAELATHAPRQPHPPAHAPTRARR